MKIFLSYADSERDQAKELATRLTDAGHVVWYHDAEASPGTGQRLKIDKALKKSNAMVVLLSPNAVRSPCVEKEIGYALGSLNYRGRLIPVEARPTPPQEVPWILNTFTGVRWGNNPAAASKRIIDQLSHLEGSEE